MAKNQKSTKNLTDDWIKQVVTGQRRKLAHMADGGEVPEYMRGLSDEQLRAIGVERPVPVPAPTPAPSSEAPLAINSIPGDPGSTVDQLRSSRKRLDEASGYKNGGCVKRMEKGGEVDGPGTGTSDSVPAMLSDGEYVLPADTVAAVGKAALDKLKNATHTPVHKPTMRGMVPHLVNGGDYVATIDDAKAKAAQAAADRSALAKSFSLQNPLLAAGMDIATLPGRGLGGAYNTAARLPNAFGANLPTIPDTSPFFGGNSASMTPYYDKLRDPQISAPAPTSTATTAVDDSPLAPTAPAAPAPAAAKPAINPNFMPTMTGPNNPQDMISEGRNLMNTQGIGGFVQAKGLNRMAQTVNQANAPLISGQYGLQEAALTANERLERAKLDEHQRQQNLETWTPDKNMMGELVGYGRTKGGTPQYVTKESLMSRPTLAQFLAKARPVNPKATDEQLTAHYNATYAEQ